MSIAKVSSKGWVVIPSELREKYNVSSGQYVKVVDYGGVLSLVPLLNDPIEEGMGALDRGPSLLKALAKERRKERTRDKKNKNFAAIYFATK